MRASPVARAHQATLWIQAFAEVTAGSGYFLRCDSAYGFSLRSSSTGGLESQSARSQKHLESIWKPRVNAPIGKKLIEENRALLRSMASRDFARSEAKDLALLPQWVQSLRRFV